MSNERYIAGVDESTYGDRSVTAIAILDRNTHKFIFFSTKKWKIKLIIWLAPLIGIKVIKETP